MSNKFQTIHRLRRSVNRNGLFSCPPFQLHSSESSATTANLIHVFFVLQEPSSSRCQAHAISNTPNTTDVGIYL